MNSKYLLLASLLTAGPALADDLSAWSVASGDVLELHVRAAGEPGSNYQLMWGRLETAELRFLADGTFDPGGKGAFDTTIGIPLPDGLAVRLVCMWRGPSGIEISEAGVPLTGGVDFQLLDFDYTLGPDEPVEGQVMANDWGMLGMTISAVNNNPAHPDLAVIFDSDQGSGGDSDLVTPGPGHGNDEALGNLLIIPEDDYDGNGDGLIDDPDDEADGGVVTFDFDMPARVCGITLVDVDDEGPTMLRFTRSDFAVETIPATDFGNNSVETVGFLKADIVRFEVLFGGSGGIASMEVEPCPQLVNLDETPFGIPLKLDAGAWITDQFGFLDLQVSAMNPVPGHPDKAILFDSENPTGDDFDLQTPGPGIGNDTPLGMVLIVAENDHDWNLDGMVDDPDDEEQGGCVYFDFEKDITFLSATVLDVDLDEWGCFDFYDADNFLVATLPVGPLGDNSVQTVVADPPIFGVRRAEFVLRGSGALTRLRWCAGEVAGGE